MPYDTPDGLPSLDPSDRRNAHTLVVIRDGGLLPPTANVEEGELVRKNTHATGQLGSAKQLEGGIVVERGGDAADG